METKQIGGTSGAELILTSTSFTFVIIFYYYRTETIKLVGHLSSRLGDGDDRPNLLSVVFV